MSSLLTLLRRRVTTLRYTNKVLALGPIVYFPQAEAAGATVMLDASGNARNGAYKGAGEPLLGQVGIGDGRTLALYDGTNDFANAFTAGLAGAFSGDECTIVLWVKFTPAAATRCMIYMEADANNFYRIRMLSGTPISYVRNAAGVSKSVANTTYAGTGFACIGVTTSKVADQFKAYLNGVQDGATQTGLANFAGALTTCVIGAQTVAGVTPWLGNGAHMAIFNRALSAAEMLSVATVP